MTILTSYTDMKNYCSSFPSMTSLNLLKNLELIHYMRWYHSRQTTGKAGNVPTADKHDVRQPTY